MHFWLHFILILLNKVPKCDLIHLLECSHLYWFKIYFPSYSHIVARKPLHCGSCFFHPEFSIQTWKNVIFILDCFLLPSAVSVSFLRMSLMFANVNEFRSLIHFIHCVVWFLLPVGVCYAFCFTQLMFRYFLFCLMKWEKMYQCIKLMRRSRTKKEKWMSLFMRAYQKRKTGLLYIEFIFELIHHWRLH